jgi:hypothetical protein
MIVKEIITLQLHNGKVKNRQKISKGYAQFAKTVYRPIRRIEAQCGVIAPLDNSYIGSATSGTLPCPLPRPIPRPTPHPPAQSDQANVTETPYVTETPRLASAVDCRPRPKSKSADNSARSKSTPGKLNAAKTGKLRPARPCFAASLPRGPAHPLIAPPGPPTPRPGQGHRNGPGGAINCAGHKLVEIDGRRKCLPSVQGRKGDPHAIRGTSQQRPPPPDPPPQEQADNSARSKEAGTPKRSGQGDARPSTAPPPVPYRAGI